MKKKIFRAVLTVFSVVMLVAAMTVMCSAEKTLVAEGYCVKKEGEGVVQTNVKWEIFEENDVQTIYFTIDKSKGDNTILYAKNATTGADIAYYQIGSGELLPWGKHTAVTDSKVKKAVVGDGITEISGAAFAYSSIETVEIPKTLVKLNGISFNRASRLDTVNVTGEPENPGAVNLKYVNIIGGNIFGGPNRVKEYILNPNYSGKIGNETFSKNSKLKQIEIPAGVTELGKNIFTGSENLSHLIIKGKNTVLTEENFGGLEAFPRIVGYVGSAAEKFAKDGGYTFINIENDKVVHEGTKPLVEIVYGEIEDPYIAVWEDFDPTGATAHGHMTGVYQGGNVVDTYWAYYKETKTLKIVSNSKSYNETGRISMADDKVGWQKYLDEIEHVVVSDFISKLSTGFCLGMTNLKTVELSRGITQMNGDVFNDCANLSTVYVRGREKIDGLADFSGMKLQNSIRGTAIRVLKLGKTTETFENIKLPGKLEKIITPYFDNEYFDTVCKEGGYDLQDSRNPENIKNYLIKVDLDPSWPMCGVSAAFEFDEKTGTLTVHGKGAIDDITNYYGGGSKTQPWFDIKEKIKHIIITEHITTIGKYNFTECVNLETVRIPNVESFIILNGAFEKCHNLKSLYVEGNDPIEGTLDLSRVKTEIFAWTFAYDYLIANVIIDETVKRIGNTTFEENLGLNLAGIYGVPGSQAEKYANKNNLTFYDISKGMPKPVTCTPPEPKDSDSDTGDDTSVPVTDTEPPAVTVETVAPIDTTEIPGGDDASGGPSIVIIGIIVLVFGVLVIGASVAGIIIMKKKSAK